MAEAVLDPALAKCQKNKDAPFQGVEFGRDFVQRRPEKAVLRINSLVQRAIK